MEKEHKSSVDNNNKEENDLLCSNDNRDKSKIKVDNELLSDIFNSPPHFEKNFENKELNKFKDEILIYLSERNQHYKTLINYFHDKIQENKKEYAEKMKSISENYSKILSSQAALNNKIEKIPNIELFINKTNDQLITHEIRINNLASDHIKATQKYDKIYLDNLELPGYIGKFAKFKNCQAFFENIIKELDKINQYKEKNNLDIKAYKEKLDGIIKSFHLLIKNNNESQMKYIKQLNDKCFKESKEMNEILGNRICDLRIENAKCSMDLVKKSDDLNKEWKKVLEIKDNILNQVNEKINQFKNIFYNNVNHFNILQKEFEEFRVEINEVMAYYREAKSDNPNNNVNINPNANSYNNFGGCYISSALPLERKNWKYFPRKFSKKAKRKTKNNNDKKYFIKSISSLNENGYKTNENIIKVDFDNASNNNININNNNNNNIIKVEDNTSKEKDLKKRSLGSSLRKEKTINSMEKYKYGSEFQAKKNINIFKDQRMSRTVTKIEINSHDKVSSFDRNKRDIEKEKEKENYSIKKKNTLNINNNSIQKILNNDTNSIATNSSISNKSQEKDKIIYNKFKKNKRSSLQANKGVQSDEIINNINNINIGNSNTLNSSKDNLSRYSTNSAVNVNKFVLNDNYFEANKVIKELASELEQSTNKKDNLASNKKIIEENFKVICNKISPLNLNKINCSGDNISLNENYNEIFQNQNLHSNLNIEENFKANTVSTEKTEEGKVGNSNRNSNNIRAININQNDYDFMNKKIDIFEKKLFDLESILKEKIFEVLSQFDNLQNIFFSSIIKNKKPNNENNINNINLSNSNNYKTLNIKPYAKMNMNRSFSIDYMDNIATCRSNDDYYIKSHSVRKIAPIVEINPNNLQFSPSPAKTQTILSNKKSLEQNKKIDGSKTGTNNFKDIKLFGKSENKENIKNLNNLDYNDINQNRLFAKNGNFLGVTKWINLNRLIKNEKTKTTNISNKGGLLASNFDNN